MNRQSNLIKKWGLVIGLLVTSPVFSESAPVYDADSLPQQFYNGAEQNAAEQNEQQNEQDVPPPAPGQEGTFVPVQSDAGRDTGSQNVGSLSSTPSPVVSLSDKQRIKRLEQQMTNLQSNDIVAHTESLQKQVQSLRGQVEQLTHQLQQLQEQQKNFYAEIDKRLTQQKSTTASSMNASDATSGEDDASAVDTSNKPNRKNNTKPDKKTSITPNKASATTSSESLANESATNTLDDQPNVAEEQQIYQTAYNLIKAKKYNDAVNALQKMLQKYPSGQFAANAHYWLGELYGLLGKHGQALAEFSTVVKTYPDSPRISDAQLKVGLIYATEAKWGEAKTAFKKVINRYPGTASARLASEQLKQIKQAGH